MQNIWLIQQSCQNSSPKFFSNVLHAAEICSVPFQQRLYFLPRSQVRGISLTVFVFMFSSFAIFSSKSTVISHHFTHFSTFRSILSVVRSVIICIIFLSVLKVLNSHRNLCSIHCFLAINVLKDNDISVIFHHFHIKFKIESVGSFQQLSPMFVKPKIIYCNHKAN